MAESEVSGVGALSAAALQLNRELGNARTEIESAMGWTRAASVWLVSVGALTLLYFLYPSIRILSLLVLLDLVVGGACFVATAFWILRLYRASQRRVEAWEVTFLPLLYRVKFELLPYSGADRLHDAWDRYKSVYRDLSWADPRSDNGAREKPLRKTVLRFETEVPGSDGTHPFGIYCSVGTERGFFARRYEQSVPVSRSQLEVLKSDVEDARKKFGERKCVVAALSPADFEPEAIEFALSPEGYVEGRFPLDLIHEATTGFTVVSVGST